MSAEFNFVGDQKFSKPGNIWKSEEWKAIGFIEHLTEDGPFWEVSLIFKTKEFAEKVFAAISDWQAEHVPPAPGVKQDLDKQNAIQLSFIMETDGQYSAYIYPTLVGVSSESTVETIVICQQFPGGRNSFFQAFTNKYKGGPFLFSARHWNNENPLLINNTNTIWKTSLKLKKRNELTKDEIEYAHGKTAMGL